MRATLFPLAIILTKARAAVTAKLQIIEIC